MVFIQTARCVAFSLASSRTRCCVRRIQRLRLGRMLLFRRDPARRMARFYRLLMQRDLFGSATLIREWGRINSPGRVRIDAHPDEAAARTAAARLEILKRRKGYG